MIDASLGLVISSLPWWLAAPLIQLSVLLFGMALDETYVNRTTVLTGAIAIHIHTFVAGDVGILVGLYGDFGLVIGAYGLYAYVTDGHVGGWFRVLAYFVYSPLSVMLVILTAGPTLFGIEPLVIPALALAAYANIQLREYLRPEKPYYFGPESQAVFEAVIETEATERAPTETAGDEADWANGQSPTAGVTAGGEPGAPAESESATRTAGDVTSESTAETASGSSPDPATATANADSDGFDEPTGDDGAEFDHPGAEPAAAADSSERGILPEFMRRL